MFLIKACWQYWDMFIIAIYNKQMFQLCLVFSFGFVVNTFVFCACYHQSDLCSLLWTWTLITIIYSMNAVKQNIGEENIKHQHSTSNLKLYSLIGHARRKKSSIYINDWDLNDICNWYRWLTVGSNMVNRRFATQYDCDAVFSILSVANMQNIK